MLEDLEDIENGERVPRYCAFGESTVRLNVAPVKVRSHAFETPLDSAKGVSEKKSWGPMGALYDSNRSVRYPSEAAPDSLDHLFMEGQLAKYKGDGSEDTYEVLRLSGTRRKNAAVGPEHETAGSSGPTVPETEVHVYDMFWSDLSGVSKTGLRIFGELYQLTFHLASIGVNNVKAAATFLRGKNGKQCDRAWKKFNNAQTSAAAILAWPIPLLNLLMLAFALGLFADAALVKFSVTVQTIVTGVVWLAVSAGALGYGLFRKGTWGVSAFRLPIVLFLILSSGVVGLALLYRQDLVARVEQIDGAATILVELAVFVALSAIVRALDKRRPGTFPVFWLILAVVVIATVASILVTFPAPTHFVAMVVLLRFIEVSFWLLLFSWMVFWILLVWAFFAGSLAVRATKRVFPGENERARRTNWTARLTIALPATMFVLLTFSGWAGLAKISMPLLPHDSSIADSNCPAASARNPNYSNMENALCYAPIFSSERRPLTVRKWTSDTMTRAGISFIPFLLLFVALAALIGIWAFAPSVLDEISPPRGPASATTSAALGKWLDDGLTFLRWGGRSLYAGVALFPLSFFVPTPHGEQIAWALGTIVGAAAVGIFGFGGRLSKLALGFRPVVRVALDVDNWMREHPRDSNPTARICGRYVSLLRYIAQWKGEDANGYDRLIIFAHSQGTVITADLLRFLCVEKKHSAEGTYGSYDPSLEGLESLKGIDLFTMGCPLRQLYGLRFPYLYGYAPEESPDKSKFDESTNDLRPEPEDLGLTRWINAYRTGDYVGRFLWRDKPWVPVETVKFSTWEPAQGIPKNIWINGKRVEFSIGPGAHTHYWDSTAEAIAETLDIVIAKP